MGRFEAVKTSSMRGKAWTAGVFGVLLLTLGAAEAGQAGKKPMTLTGVDYERSNQLMSPHTRTRSIHCAGNGYGYADLYTPDGTFIDMWTQSAIDAGGVKWQGREKLREIASGANVTGAPCTSSRFNGSVSHLILNLVITPTPDGATGNAYMVEFGRSRSEQDYADGQLRGCLREDARRLALQDANPLPRSERYEAGAGADAVAVPGDVWSGRGSSSARRASNRRPCPRCTGRRFGPRSRAPPLGRICTPYASLTSSSSWIRTSSRSYIVAFSRLASTPFLLTGMTTRRLHVLALPAPDVRQDRFAGRAVGPRKDQQDRLASLAQVVERDGQAVQARQGEWRRQGVDRQFLLRRCDRRLLKRWGLQALSSPRGADRVMSGGVLGEDSGTTRHPRRPPPTSQMTITAGTTEPLSRPDLNAVIRSGPVSPGPRIATNAASPARTPLRPKVGQPIRDVWSWPKQRQSGFRPEHQVDRNGQHEGPQERDRAHGSPPGPVRAHQGHGTPDFGERDEHSEDGRPARGHTEVGHGLARAPGIGQLGPRGHAEDGGKYQACEEDWHIWRVRAPELVGAPASLMRFSDGLRVGE